MTSLPEDSRADRIRAAFERISRWMNAHGAPLLVENLAPGATAERLAEAEAELGIALPEDLRAMWSLHDGQREEGNGFFEGDNFLSVQWACAEKETVLMSIEFARESPERWPATGGTMEELASDHWLPFAAQDSDAIVVHGITGRVFACDHDDSPRLLAPSLVAWLEEYAARVDAGDYVVEEGFGDYYLQLRDREAERRAQERAAREAERERFRRETPLLDQLRKGLAEKNADRCTEVLQDAMERGDTDALKAAIALLFGERTATPEPKFVAATLRPLLKAVTLEPDQWAEVATGGALLGNNAVRDVALAHCAGASAERIDQLAAASKDAPAGDRPALDDVLQRLRAMATPQGPRGKQGDQGNQGEEPQGSWWSRVFGKRPPKA
jgi:cell wall assembly regulator SMI1